MTTPGDTPVDGSAEGSGPEASGWVTADTDVVPLAITEFGTERDAADDGVTAGVGAARGRAGGRAPVVVLHGLFGSGRNWMTAGRRLAGDHHVLAPDLRNHGSSPWSDTMTYEAMAADVTAVLDDRAVAVSLVGHSMGGKAAMLVALRRPDLVERLVIVDVAPVSYPSTFAAYARAMRSVDLSSATRRADVDAQLAGAVPDAGVRAFLLQNLVLDPRGARWRVNLPVIEAAMPTISDFPVIPAHVRFQGPTLFVAGGTSSYVRREDVEAARPRFPRARLTVIRKAGHWVHAERLDDFLAVLTPFLDTATVTHPA